VVVGVDGSADSVAALLWAAPEARRRGAVLQIVAVWEGDPVPGSGSPGSARIATRRLDRALRHLRREERRPDRIECDAATGDLGMAAGGNGRVPGTTGRYCLRHAHLPVVFVAGPFRA
jgi:nucleotide-binding universal stress UspA family protein